MATYTPALVNMLTPLLPAEADQDTDDDVADAHPSGAKEEERTAAGVGHSIEGSGDTNKLSTVENAR